MSVDVYVLLGGGCYRKVTVSLADLMSGRDLSPDTLATLNLGTLYVRQSAFDAVPARHVLMRMFFTITSWNTPTGDLPMVCSIDELNKHRLDPGHAKHLADFFVHNYPDYVLNNHIHFIRASATGYTFNTRHPQYNPDLMEKSALTFMPAHHFLAIRTVVRGEVVAGLQMLQACHEAGLVRSTRALGTHYLSVAKDVETGLKYLTQGHGLGDVGATADLAEYCRTQGDVRTAMLAQELVQRHDLRGMYLLGTLYREGTLVAKDVAKGKQLLLQAAERGHAPAQYAVARGLLNGTDWPVDVPKGMIALQKAATDSCPEAQYEIGLRWFYGNGCIIDVPSALMMLRTAANNRNVGATHFLANFYLNQQPPPMDAVRGINLLRTLEARGHDEGSYQLALALMMGDGTQRDPRQAYDIMQRLAKKGHQPAIDFVIAHMKYLSSLWEHNAAPVPYEGEVDASSMLPQHDAVFTEELPVAVPPSKPTELAKAGSEREVNFTSTLAVALAEPEEIPPSPLAMSPPDKRPSSSPYAPRARQSPTKRR